MLNDKHFVLLAGNPSPWDQELLKRASEGESLVDIQEDQHERGRRSLVLTQTQTSWITFLASNLDSRKRLFEGTKEECLEFGKSWALDDPKKREFFVSKALA